MDGDFAAYRPAGRRQQVDGARRPPISHFYDSAEIFGDVFVGALIFIGIFLILHNGDQDQGPYRWLENIFIKLAGLAAFGIALLPAEQPGCAYGGERARVFAFVSGNQVTDPSIAEAFSAGPGVGVLHYVCAGIMFAFLAYYVLVVFTRVRAGHEQTDESGRMVTRKRVRNGIYYVAGFVIVLSMVLMFAHGFLGLSPGMGSSVGTWRA